MNLLGWVFFLLALGGFQYERTGLWLYGEGNPLLGSPVAMASKGEKTYVLDQSDFQIKVLDHGGVLSHRFGEKGQGPAEFELPVSLALVEQELWVFDGNKGKVLKFTVSGEFIGALDLIRGYGADFFSEGVLVKAVFDKHLFHRYNLSGERLLSFGEGFTKTSGIFDAYNFIAETTIDEATGRFFVFYQHGRFFEEYSLKDGTLLREQGLDLQRFTAKPEKKSQVNDGKGVFVLKNGQPVQGVVKNGRHFCVLIHDETAEEVSYLGLLNEKGIVQQLQPTPHYFTDMFYQDSTFTFTNVEEGTLIQYRIDITD